MSVLTMIAQGIDPAMNRSRAEGETARLKNEGQAISNLAKTAELDEFMATTGTRRYRKNQTNRFKGRVAEESVDIVPDIVDAEQATAQQTTARGRVERDMAQAEQVHSTLLSANPSDFEGLMEVKNQLADEVGQDRVNELWKGAGLDQGFSRAGVERLRTNLENTIWHNAPTMRQEHLARFEARLKSQFGIDRDKWSPKTDVGKAIYDLEARTREFAYRYGTDKSTWPSFAKNEVAGLEEQLENEHLKETQGKTETIEQLESRLKQLTPFSVEELDNARVVNTQQVNTFIQEKRNQVINAGGSMTGDAENQLLRLYFEPQWEGDKSDKKIRYVRKPEEQVRRDTLEYYLQIAPEGQAKMVRDLMLNARRAARVMSLEQDNVQAVDRAREVTGAASIYGNTR